MCVSVCLCAGSRGEAEAVSERRGNQWELRLDYRTWEKAGLLFKELGNDRGKKRNGTVARKGIKIKRRFHFTVSVMKEA